MSHTIFRVQNSVQTQLNDALLYLLIIQMDHTDRAVPDADRTDQIKQEAQSEAFQNELECNHLPVSLSSFLIARIPPRNITIQPKLSKPDAKPRKGSGRIASNRKPIPAISSGVASTQTFFSGSTPFRTMAIQPPVEVIPSTINDAQYGMACTA